MYIEKEQLQNGLNPYLKIEEGKGCEVGMDVALLMLERGEVYRECNAEKEAAFLLFSGACVFIADGNN